MLNTRYSFHYRTDYILTFTRSGQVLPFTALAALSR